MPPQRGGFPIFVKRLLQLNLLVSAIIAVSFIFLPKQTLSLYGIVCNNALTAIAQYYGATHVAFAVLLWLGLRAADARVLRSITASFFAGDFAGTAVLLVAQLNGVMNAMGWSLVGLSLLFAVGYGIGVVRGLPAAE